MKKLCLERKRTERSRSHFVLMLLECQASNRDVAFAKVLCTLSPSTRETDIRGWYKEGDVIGVIFTEIGAAEGTAGDPTRVARRAGGPSPTPDQARRRARRRPFRPLPAAPVATSSGGLTACTV